MTTKNEPTALDKPWITEIQRLIDSNAIKIKKVVISEEMTIKDALRLSKLLQADISVLSEMNEELTAICYETAIEYFDEKGEYGNSEPNR